MLFQRKIEDAKKIQRNNRLEHKADLVNAPSRVGGEEGNNRVGNFGKVKKRQFFLCVVVQKHFQN